MERINLLPWQIAAHLLDRLPGPPAAAAIPVPDAADNPIRREVLACCHDAGYELTKVRISLYRHAPSPDEPVVHRQFYLVRSKAADYRDVAHRLQELLLNLGKLHRREYALLRVPQAPRAALLRTWPRSGARTPLEPLPSLPDFPESWLAKTGDPLPVCCTARIGPITARIEIEPVRPPETNFGRLGLHLAGRRVKERIAQLDQD